MARRCNHDIPCVTAIHGAWGIWTSWSTCSTNCGTGIVERTRQCDSPSPDHGGDNCHGHNRETQQCTDESACVGAYKVIYHREKPF